jgi:hypothetical protein
MSFQRLRPILKEPDSIVELTLLIILVGAANVAVFAWVAYGTARTIELLA